MPNSLLSVGPDPGQGPGWDLYWLRTRYDSGGDVGEGSQNSDK